MKFLVTGSEGYIGSHMVALLRNMYEVVQLKSDLRDYDSLFDEIKSYGKLDGVFHFAGLIQVGESTKNIRNYYNTNVMGTTNLLESLALNNTTKKIVFSSSAAASGTLSSPYGSTKKIGEMLLDDYYRSYGIKYVALRYFNAAGANVSNGLYENHQPETHIIPLIIKAAKYNKEFTIFGNDYDTPDGTNVRDYIHVDDLAQAHLNAVEYLNVGDPDIFDLGTGQGTSNLQLVKLVESITGLSVKYKFGDRRSGDPDTLIADTLPANEKLCWKSTRSIEDVVMSAYVSLKDRL